MKKHLPFLIAIISVITLLNLTSCLDDDDDDDNNNNNNTNSGQIGIEFTHFADGMPIEFDTLMYTNAAGNNYLVYEIQYFISQLTLYKGGTATVLKGWKTAHYVDTDIQESKTWNVFDQIPAGTYDSLAFTFGFSDADNQSFAYVNPPENAMVWPEYLGGGYHYMKLNGKWIDSTSNLRGFAFHLGRGQVYTGGNPTSFIDNSFRISFTTPISIIVGSRKMVTLKMNVEEWFKNPNTYDHNVHGGDIMQTQDAMHLGCVNGKTVFELLVP